MGRDESPVQIQELFDDVDDLDTEELQARVDASEDGAAARYRALRSLSPLVSDAVRHAEAMTRLDVALRLAGAR
jgi:hypothetical protein